MADFSELKAYLDTLHTDGKLPSGDIVVTYKGEPVFRYMVGYADEARTVPVSEDTMYMLYSCSKPITVAAALQLTERGLLGLDDPVMTYLPEFAEAYVIEDDRRVTVGHTMTVRHLLTMSAGLDYTINRPAVLALQAQNPRATTREMVAAFVQDPLKFRPGARWEYSLCLDVLAAVIEAASGMTFGAYLQQNIFDPLGMKDATFHPTPAQLERVAAQYVCTQEKDLKVTGKSIGAFRMSELYESGGAGIYATTGDLAKFVAAMACGGVAADGTRILKAESVDEMRTEQLKGLLENSAYGSGAGPNYGYGLGVRTLLNRNDGEPSRVGEFGWDGAAGAYVLMDPEVQVGIAYCQHTLAWPHMYWGAHNRMRGYAYAALGL